MLCKCGHPATDHAPNWKHDPREPFRLTGACAMCLCGAFSSASERDLEKSRADTAALVEALQRRIKELEAWKDEAIACTPDWQAIGEELGLEIGDTVHDKILPALKSRREYAIGLRAKLLRVEVAMTEFVRSPENF